LASILGGLLAAPLAADAQEPEAGKMPQLGWLGLGSCSGSIVETFRRGLREHGWVEGQNIRPIVFRCAEGNAERLPGLVEELLLLNSDVIITPGGAAPSVAARITKTVPIIMLSGGDPVASRIVSSLARPGGNVTGLATISSALSGKRLQLLRAVIPKATRIAVLTNPANPSHPTALNAAQVAARSLGLQLVVVEYRGQDDLAAAFQAATRRRADGVIVLDDSVTFSYRAVIAELAAKNRLPALHGFREAAESGGLMAYGADLVDQSRRAVIYVDKVLRGAKPADLPIEQPTKFEFVINLKTARALGLTIPPSLLQQADQVIE
jgi:putative tryptophan/tyrosine transport system substrate-binding protein